MFSFQSSCVGDITADDSAFECQCGIRVDDPLRLSHVEDHRGLRRGHLEVEGQPRCRLVDIWADEGWSHHIVSWRELKYTQIRG